MCKYVYPARWSDLRQTPSARFEFIGFISEIATWNEECSDIKKNGADSMIAVLFDSYNIDEGTKHLVGGLIFPDELELVDKFASAFSSFVESWQNHDKKLIRLHEAILDEDLVTAAVALHRKLIEKGMPAYIGA